MKDYVELWDMYSIDFCKKLEYEAHGEWGLLDEDEQEIAALWKFLVDMYNGGFLHFFCNWGFSGYWYAMRGIQRIGDANLLSLLHHTYYDIFEKFKEDSRLTSYWDIAKYLSDDDKRNLNITDTFFYEKGGEKFAELAYHFYRETLNKLPDTIP